MRLTHENSESLSLLYVEDEFDSRVLLSSMIETRYPDIKLFIAENGQEGLDFYTQCKTEILVTDISMPHMDGLTMASEIKKLNPEVMIIVLTALSDTNNLLDCIDIGINQYVLKPVDNRQLFEAINKCIETISVRRTVERQHNFIASLNARLTARTQELENLNHELEAFNYTVSHDLRAPLNVINGYCQILKEMYGPAMDSTGLGFINEISGGVYQMDDLIKTLLNFSRINRSDLRMVNMDLGKIATEISDRLKMSQKAERSVTFHIPEGIKATGDQSLLQVLLENILGNAWKYTESTKEATIEFGVEKVNGREVYFVRDNGIGFDNSYADSIFSPFKRLDNGMAFEGSGIGLATVRRIIQRHGGEVWAEGKVGKGATIYFTLPGSI